MSGNSDWINFSRYQMPENAGDSDIYADSPILFLQAKQDGKRHERQLSPFLKAQTITDPVFGASLDWAYREYSIVHRLPVSAKEVGQDTQSNPERVPGVARESHAQLFNLRPRQPVDYKTRQDQIKKALSSGDGEHGAEQALCLFSLIVALEWAPSTTYLRQLEWAFRRASDFLYDVTDGRMAFGQVVFGGPEFMHCADIQIMASTRFSPRSWVNGLTDETKYLPIRIGRGQWHKNNHVTIPWDEPEGYRTIVHEWGHYALGLVDEYLETHFVSLPSEADLVNMSAQRLIRGMHTVIIPRISLTTESIMGTTEGTSELVAHTGGGVLARKEKEWQTIKEHYPFLNPPKRPLEGPGELPLPLPSYHRLVEPGDDELVLVDFPKGIALDHCWVYLLKGTPAAPKHIIAQGTLDARVPANGFQLLGAAAGDTVVFISKDNRGRPSVVYGIVQEGQRRGETRAVVKQWEAATPDFPMIDVQPGPVAPTDQQAEVSVRVSGFGEHPPEQVWLFPLGQMDTALKPLEAARPDWQSLPQELATLDGHVLATWEGGKQFVICTFSQGGGPETNSPHSPPTLTAGSSEGNIMVFFEDKDRRNDYATTRLVTTLVPGVIDKLENGAEARSYAFSLAGNEPLPLDLHPTLIIYYDQDAERAGGDLLIYRHVEGDQWRPMPTYLPEGSSFAAMPLNAETAARLISFDPDGNHVERYRLYWTPHNGASVPLSGSLGG